MKLTKNFELYRVDVTSVSACKGNVVDPGDKYFLFDVDNLNNKLLNFLNFQHNLQQEKFSSYKLH